MSLIALTSLLPQEDTQLQKVEKVEGGFSNDLWRVNTTKNSYILRVAKKHAAASDFTRVLEISKRAFESDLAPRVVGASLELKQMLLEYVDSVPWPPYEVNAEPYKATMKALKCFHEKMPRAPIAGTDFVPFTFIFQVNKSLVNPPEHYSRALQKMANLFEDLKPWLEKHAVLCHGDFHKGNVLLAKIKALCPVVIDFDSMGVGDPLFDVVKFSVALLPKVRMELFEAYLGHPPTSEEQSHFEKMDLALLMVIFSVRFLSAQKAEGERLSKKEMEEILDSKEPLPSFLKIPFGDTSPKSRQKGALYALGEFLKRSASV